MNPEDKDDEKDWPITEWDKEEGWPCTVPDNTPNVPVDEIPETDMGRM